MTAYQYQSNEIKGPYDLDSAVVIRFCNHGYILRNVVEHGNTLLIVF